MTTSSPEAAGYSDPRPTTDPYIAEQYDKLGLGDAPSLADIEPIAIGMLRDRQLLEGIGLVLGRRIDARDTLIDHDLGDIAMLAMKDPEQAFGSLLLKLTIERLESEQ